jgi:ribonuclease HI
MRLFCWASERCELKELAIFWSSATPRSSKIMWKKKSEAKEPELIKYLAEVRKMERHFRGFTIEHLPRKRNGEADELAKKASRGEAMPLMYFLRS